MKKSHINNSGLASLVAVSLACGMLCLIAGCSYKGSKEIVGKWKAKDGTSLTEFHADGTFILGGDKEMAGKYKFVGSDKVKLTLDGPMGKVIGGMVFRAVINGDTLEMTDPDGEKQVFQRVK
jgi:hypothetical protein